MLKHLFILGGIVAIFLWMARETAWFGPYIYDEADYMYDVSLGWKANWTDSPTLRLGEFLQLGMHLDRTQSQRAELSELIRDRDDVVFYRHWHGPVYGDWLRCLRALDLDERSTRALGKLLPVAVAGLLYFGALWVMPGAGGQIAAIVGAAIYLWSFPVVRSTELAPHQMFAGCVVAGLLLLARMGQTSGAGRRDWYAAAAVTGLAFCVLEIAFALILTLLICGYLERGLLKPNLAFAAKSVGAFLAPVLLFWPAAVFKLSFIKAYLFMAYLALYRKGAWGSDISIGATWWLRLVNSPVIWILLAVAVGFFFKNRRQTPLLTPFAIFSALMSLAIFPVNTDFPRYTLPLLPGVVLLAAFATGLWSARRSALWRTATAAVICAAMFATSWPKVRAQLPGPNHRANLLLALTRNYSMPGQTLLVPHDDMPMLHYYLPGVRFKTYDDESAIEQALRSEAIDGVVYGAPPRFVPVGLRKSP
jgi:hypothetical protein